MISTTYKMDTAVSNSTKLQLNTGAGSDTVNVNSTLNGAEVQLGDGDDIINVTKTLSSYDWKNFHLGDGDDIINIENGSGRFLGIYGGNGNDSLILAGNFSTNSYFSGQEGNDTIDISNATGFAASQYSQHIDAGQGNDSLIGNNEGNILVGGNHDDILNGGKGNDVLYGNRKNSKSGDSNYVDIAVYSGTSNDYQVSRATDSTFGYVYYIQDKRDGSPDGLDTLYEIDKLRFSDGEVNLENYYHSQIGSGAGNDIITGTPENDLIDGFGGNDTITGLGGDDFLIGGDGDDEIDGGSGTNRLYGDAGDDIITSSGSYDFVDGGEGDNKITITSTAYATAEKVRNLSIRFRR